MNQGLFKAAGNEEVVRVEGTLINFNNAKVVVEFHVTTPKSVRFDWLDGGITVLEREPANGWWTIVNSSRLEVYYGPDDVCFYRVEPGETYAAPSSIQGWFELVAPQPADWFHEEWDGGGFLDEVTSGKGTRLLATDFVINAANKPPPINGLGRFQWNLQWKYRLKGALQPGIPFYPVTQWFKIVAAAPGKPNRNGYTGRGGKGDVTIEPE